MHGLEVLEQEGEGNEVKLVRRGSQTCAYQARTQSFLENFEITPP